MAAFELREHQKKALSKMKDGCILCGGVGTGKSITSLAYYCTTEGGTLEPYPKMAKTPRKLYIITTARKRDTFEWEAELVRFCINNKDVVIDSWNNIKKYADVKNAFFIFDEQRVIGYGAWTKAFLKIARSNRWILLSATPGDTWSDYIPVFIANGFYRNKTEFITEHVIYSRFSQYPKIDRYVNTGRLIRLRNDILVDMPMVRPTVRHIVNVTTEYDRTMYKTIMKTRWDPYNKKPIDNASGLCQLLRKVVNADPSRLEEVIRITNEQKKVIIFYNYDYEREILLGCDFGKDVQVAEWTGHAHEDLPRGERWVYLVQYNAGSEGWNCTSTNTIIFYSQSYSYRQMEQSMGRIDRMNTPYRDLYYYILKSSSPIDNAIAKALNGKKNFNEGRFFNRL